jgi:hypothetical protein
MPSERRRNRLCRSQQAIHGPRLSVVHPASTATKPIGIVTWHARRYHLLLNSFRLEWHYDPGHHPHAERDREDPNPEVPDPEVDSVSGSEMQPFQQGDVDGAPTVNAGNRMCQPITQANWIRERRSGSGVTGT